MTKVTHQVKLKPKPFRWNHEKNQLLKTERNITFEEMVLAIEADGLLDVLDHP